MKVLDYNMEQYDKVAILGAGPSLQKNMNIVNAFAKQDCLVIGTSYNFTLRSDYTMVVGKSVFRSAVKTIKSTKMIITDWVLKNNKSLIKKTSSKFDYWLMQTTCQDASHKYWEGDVNIKNGIFDHHLSNCGFTALLASHFFSPKQVMIAGFDGPDNTGYTMPHFNGKTRVQKGIHKDKDVSLQKGQFLRKIISFVNSRGTKITAFRNDGLWGMDSRGLAMDFV